MPPVAWQTPARPKTAPQRRLPAQAASAAETPRPKFRGQSSEVASNLVTPLNLPTPEALGLVSSAVNPGAAAVEVDWNDLRARLHRLGAVGFHLDQIAADQWRATFLLPLGPGQTRHVDASASSDAAALAGALQQAEKFLPPR
jgi:hypothetical protein